LYLEQLLLFQHFIELISLRVGHAATWPTACWFIIELSCYQSRLD